MARCHTHISSQISQEKQHYICNKSHSGLQQHCKLHYTHIFKHVLTWKASQRIDPLPRVGLVIDLLHNDELPSNNDMIIEAELSLDSAAEA